MTLTNTSGNCFPQPFLSLHCCFGNQHRQEQNEPQVALKSQQSSGPSISAIPQMPVAGVMVTFLHRCTLGTSLSHMESGRALATLLQAKLPLLLVFAVLDHRIWLFRQDLKIHFVQPIFLFYMNLILLFK